MWQTSNTYNKNDIYIYVYVSTHTHSEAKKTIEIYKADQLHGPSRLSGGARGQGHCLKDKTFSLVPAQQSGEQASSGPACQVKM